LEEELKNAITTLALIGLIDAIYLTWIKAANQVAICGGIGDCELVNSSLYSELFGLPIALYGAGAYLAILLLNVLEDRSDFLQENGPMLVFGLSLAGVLYSAYLTYIELYVLKAVCPYCVLSAVVLLGLLIVSGMRLRLHWREV
jgi:uncharacterized membrane protein